MEVTVAEAIRRILHAASASCNKELGLSKAHGRVLRTPVIAHRDQPPFDASAMDGYAVSRVPALGEAFQVIGESMAGHAYEGPLAEDEAVRIFTGAPMPAGASQVILQEHVQRAGGAITVTRSCAQKAKTNVRLRGSDFCDGDGLLPVGERLDAWNLSLAAAAGATHVTIASRPRVAIVCAGDELASAGQMPRPDQIYESNSHALRALIKDWGAKPVETRIRPDDRRKLGKILSRLEADILVTIGGASVGDYDHVKPVLTGLGLVWAFDKVDMRPGRPTAFGKLPDGRLVLCLPGNPGSTLVGAQLFLKPLIGQMLGLKAPESLPLLPIACALPANGPWEAYLRAQLIRSQDGTHCLLPFAEQDSSLIQNFANAQVLIRRAAHAPPAGSGTLVNYIRLGRNQAGFA